MSEVTAVRAANDRYAAMFTKGDLPMPPARRLVILTCMDARIDPAQAFGVAEGDAHVVRSQQLLDTREVLVVHHTDCGMLTFTNEQLRERLRTTLGADASHVDFLPFPDLEQSVRDDVAAIRASPLLPEDLEVRADGRWGHEQDGVARRRSRARFDEGALRQPRHGGDMDHGGG